MKITKKVFTDLAIFMITLGLLIGLLFPFFTFCIGIPTYYIFNLVFFISCISAGIIVGLLNYILVKMVVGKRLKLLATHMSFVEKKLLSKSSAYNIEECLDDECLIEVDSEDEIGESIKAFNNLVQALSSSFKTEEAVRSFSEMLSSNLEIEKLADEALTQLLDHMSASAGAILIENSGELDIVSSYSINNYETLVDNKLIYKVLKTQKSKSISFPEDIRINNVLIDFTPKEVIIEPVTYKNVSIGVILLASSEYFNEDIKSNIKLFSQNLALAFRNAITHDQLQKLAAKDPLTGIYNRRFGMVRLHEEFSRAIRTDSPIGVIMFDIDFFKSINDTYGHIVGDKVLVRVANLARSALREGDILIRFGGEEFFALLPGASKLDAQKIAERIRHIIEECSIQNNGDTIKTTISAGVTSYPEFDVTDEDNLLQIADEALYTAKETGRNKVIIM